MCALEDKGTVISIHYRSSPQPAAARQAILEASKRVLPQDGLIIAEGKMVVEVRPPLAIDKGTVVRDLVREHGLRGIVYLGDDLTDVDAFRAVRELREEGEVLGLTAGVAGAEAPDRAGQRLRHPTAGTASGITVLAGAFPGALKRAGLDRVAEATYTTKRDGRCCRQYMRTPLIHSEGVPPHSPQETGARGTA